MMKPAVLPVMWWFLAFLCGALPLSVWVGRLALGVDIRAFGDGNPGATNVFRAGGKGWGVVALLLDFLKGAIPIAIVNFSLGVEGWVLATIALAPIIGHAYSPFLGWQGGKALAATFGVWAGLSLFVVPVLLGILFAFWLYFLRPEGWAVLAGCVNLLLALLAMGAEMTWLQAGAGTLIVLAWTHRQDLRQRPRLRPWRQPPADL